MAVPFLSTFGRGFQHGAEVFAFFGFLLTMIGGITGILLGSAGAAIVSHLLSWPTLISVQSITLAFLFSAFVGIFFGFYPARKAAMLNPIDALRYE